jgi:uncharacterized protein YecE (DUF72 family)
MTMLDPAKDIKIGTSGYSYPGVPPKGWRGAFYPEKKPKGFDELTYYSQIFTTCEINNTFYRPPSAKVTKAWASKTPNDFLFSLKVWQKFTHPMKISSRKKSDEKWEPVSKKDFDEFRAGILPLAEAGKLGVLLFQYPISFTTVPRTSRVSRKCSDHFTTIIKSSSFGIRAGARKVLRSNGF